MKIAGSVAVVTGASRGLGRALAAALAARGAKVALVARDAGALEEVAAAVRRQGGEAQTLPFDLHDYTAAADLLGPIEHDLGPIDLLVCNAAMGTAGEIADVPLQAFEENLAVNFLAPVALAQAAVRRMRERRRGTICFVVSGAAFRPLPGFATYSCAKAALGAFADALRVEGRDLGVRVVSVFPGTMDTEFMSRVSRFGPMADVAVPRRRRSPERVAQLVVRALERDRERVWVRGAAWLVRHLDPFAASVVDRVLVRRRRRQAAAPR